MSKNTVTEFFRFLKESKFKFEYDPKVDNAYITPTNFDLFPIVFFDFSHYFDGENFQGQIDHFKDIVDQELRLFNLIKESKNEEDH